MELAFLLVLFFFWSFFSIIVALYGRNRQIGFWATFLISIITSPVIGFIIAALSPRKAAFGMSSTYIHNSGSSADEILKYKNLLDTGVITRQEFEAFKKKILNQ